MGVFSLNGILSSQTTRHRLAMNKNLLAVSQS